MPIYEYECKSCGVKFDKLVRSMSDDADAPGCPECNSRKTSRALSVFAVGAEAGKKTSARSSSPGTCGRCGGPGPCASG